MKYKVLILNILGWAIVFSFSLACAKKSTKGVRGGVHTEHNSNLSKMTEFEVGYYDSSGAFQVVSSGDVQSYYETLGYLSSGSSITNYYLVDTTIGGLDVFSLIMIATNGASVIGIRSDMVADSGGGYALAPMDGDATTCICKSTGCNTWGCNVSEIGPCSCSPCGEENGNCEKTNGRIPSSYVATVFQSM